MKSRIKIRFKILCILLISNNNIFTQGKYTQFYSNPLSINAANTGRFDNNYRINLISKKETISNISYQESKLFSCDIKLDNLNNEKNDFLGLGLLAESEENTDVGIKNSILGLSFSYTKTLSENGKNLLSLGFKGITVHKTIEKKQYFTESDLIEFFKLGISFNNLFTFQGVEINYKDLSVGLTYQGTFNDNNSYLIGLSLNNITKPNVSFNNGNYDVKREFTSNLIWIKKISIYDKLRTSLYANYIENKLDYLIIGSNFEKYIKSYVQFIVGVWFRKQYKKNYLNPTLGINFGDIKICSSYSANLGYKKGSSYSNGGFEISFSYSFKNKKQIVPKSNIINL